MGRLIKRRHSLICAIRSQRILSQIIRSDAEKLHEGSQPIDNQSRGRNLNHRSRFHLCRSGNIRRFQLIPRLPQQGQGRDQLLFCRDHREHHPDLSSWIRPADRPQLSLE